MSDTNDKVEALAESVAEDRARLDDTVKQIQSRLTPGQLIDEVLRQGGEPTRNTIAAIVKSVSAHPIPTLLIGAALLWLAIEHVPKKAD
jgi:hypothetical protein